MARVGRAAARPGEKKLWLGWFERIAVERLRRDAKGLLKGAAKGKKTSPP
jgi:hypothetical protein